MFWNLKMIRFLDALFFLVPSTYIWQMDQVQKRPAPAFDDRWNIKVGTEICECHQYCSFSQC